ncbi:hypothetical protein Bpfe_006264, partial [Biomphalaria pfeifferi]
MFERTRTPRLVGRLDRMLKRLAAELKVVGSRYDELRVSRMLLEDVDVFLIRFDGRSDGQEKASRSFYLQTWKKVTRKKGEG